MYRKLILVFLLFFFSVSVVYSSVLEEVEVSFPNGQTYNYDYFYNISDEESVLKPRYGSYEEDEVESFKQGYNYSGSSSWLSNSEVCQLRINDGYELSSNFNNSKQHFIEPLENKNENILEQNYYMKTYVVLQVKNSEGNVVKNLLPDQIERDWEVDGRIYEDYSYDNTGDLLNDSIGGELYGFSTTRYGSLGELEEPTGASFPYVLGKPNDRELSFNKHLRRFCINERLHGGDCRNYNYEIKAVPIDGKCDMNSAGGLESDEIINSSLEIFQNQEPEVDTSIEAIDSDSDGVIDIYEIDRCVKENEDKDGKVFFAGCSEPQRINEMGSIELPGYDIYDKFRDLKVNTTTQRVELVDATKTTNKLVYDYGEKQYYFIDANGQEQVVEDFTPFRSAMDVFQDGKYIEKQLLNEDIFTLDAFKIRPFSSSQDMRDFMEKSSEIMNKTNITKSKQINEIENTKQINLSMNNFPTNNPTTMYMIFDKSLTIDQIKPKNSSGEFFIQEKDPVIGWYFNESDGEEEVNYEVPEGEDEGTIIVTQEPILFNEGELIVNYRNTNCNSDETQLFQLDELENSPVYSTGDKNFKICLSHQEENVGEQTQYENAIGLGNITPNNNITKSGNDVGASINKNKNDNYVWDKKVQEENPDGNYSCVGSYAPGNPSRFGDCGFYPEKRLWVHFGQDTVAPNTTIDIPRLAHTIRVEINIEERPVYGSGLDKVSYCVTNKGESCNIENGETRDLTGDQESFSITQTCPNDWGCNKVLRIAATDNFGNKEDVKEFDLKIIEKGSSCQASCMSVPSPNRYLKECNNLNGCQYYETNNDKGEHVAELCNLQIEDAWVKYNETHDIQCPGGPLRPTQFTQNDLEISTPNCRATRTTPYPIVFNGESMIMNVISCVE